jgi:nucleoside-diphosphate-sugar epimerase
MRIFYAYGPRQRLESLIPSILTNLKQGKLPELQYPKNANDFIYVDDIVNAFSQAVVVNNSSMIYNLGSGVSTPVLEVCRIAENIVLGTETLTQEVNIRSKGTLCDVDFWADCTHSKRYLDWQPTTSLVDGIHKTWQWLNCSE